MVFESSNLIQQSFQVSVVFVLVLIGSWLLRNASAHWRYLLWLLVVAKCLVPACFCLQLAIWPSDSNAETAQDSIGFANVGDEIAASPNRRTAEVVQSGSSSVLTQKSAPQSRPEIQTEQSQAVSSSVQRDRGLESVGPGFGFWFASTWFVTVCFLAGFVFCKAIETEKRLRIDRRQADPRTQQKVAALATQLGIRKAPEVFVADSVAQPFVWGLWRGSVYLPTAFAKSCSAEQQHAILTHELAHVARFDAAINLAQVFAQIIFFFHPLVWIANKRIRKEREKCCDEVVLAGPGAGPQQYCEAIVEMLAREVRAKRATPGLTTASSTKYIEDRIVTIMTPDRKFRRRPTGLAFIVLLVVAVAALSTSFTLTNRSVAQELETDSIDDSKQEEAVANDWKPGHLLDLRVIHAETREPMADVKLQLQNQGPGIDFGDVEVFETDSEGRAQVKMCDLPPTAVRIYPSKPGFVPLRIYWAAEPSPLIPETITIPMQVSTQFGATIVDEAGEPIPDVKVGVQYWGPGEGENPSIRANIYTTTSTDMSGNWNIDMTKEGIDYSRLAITVYHPDYVCDHERRAFIENSVVEKPTLEKLADQSAVMTLVKGESITGLVVDEHDRPIFDARVHVREYHWMELNGPRATSDADGGFQVAGLKPDENGASPFRSPNHEPFILTVEADGYAPELVEVADRTSKMKVKLKPGGSATIRVVDEKGEPIKNAYVQARNWRGIRNRIHITGRSDAEGRFQLEDLPTDEVLCDFSLRGYMHVNKYSIKPSDKEYVITLKNPLKVVGTVRDVDTGKPIEFFKVVPCFDNLDGRAPRAIDSRTIPFRNGQYEISLDQVYSYRVRIEADGYMPEKSRIYKPHDPDAGVLTWNVELKKANPVSGTVYGLDGTALANAEVYQVIGLTQIMNSKVSYSDAVPVRTDEFGQFELPPEIEPFCLVVTHEDGIALVRQEEHDEDTPIELKQWADVITKSLYQVNPQPSEKTKQQVDFPK